MIPSRQPGVATLPGMRPLNAALASPAPAAPSPVVPAPVFEAKEDDKGVVHFVPKAPSALDFDPEPIAPPLPAAPAPVVSVAPAALLTQLQQFITATPTAKIQNKAAADALADKGLVAVSCGFTVITKKGIVYLVDFGLL